MKYITTFLSIVFVAASADAKPLKVFILAGQSNMEGHAKITTFDYIGDDPATAPLLKEMRNADGSARVCDDVWISYLTGDGKVTQGKLTAGFGASEAEIGPELTFGITMQKQLKEPILLIKTAWGGKDLFCDFRSPSADKATFAERKTGEYYGLMVAHVNKVLSDIKSAYPNYDAQQGYEIGGFIWFQGWNDMCNNDVYPERNKPGGYELYSTLLTHFIRDVRKDFNAPKMPFVIGVMGVDGIIDENYDPRYKVQHTGFREAMAAPAALPEFEGNVLAVETAPFWDKKLGELLQKKDKSAEEEALIKRGASNAAYHYLGCAKTMALIGKAFAEANFKLMQSPQVR